MDISSFSCRGALFAFITGAWFAADISVARAIGDTATQQETQAQTNADSSQLTDRKWISRWLAETDPPLTAVAADPQRPERRVLFDPDKYWTTSAEAIKKVIAEAKRAGFNVLVVPLWQGAGTRYPSAFAPWNAAIEHQLSLGIDPFAELLAQAHRNGLEVHAWFNVVQRRAGILSEFYGEDTPRGAFDVHNKKFRDFVVSLVAEVVEKYDVDGVNLDHVRSMGICKSRRCINNYAQQTGRDLITDALMAKLPGRSRDSITRWNYAAVTDVVSRVSTLLRSRLPVIPLSVDAHPNDPRLLWQGQDSVRWANEGLVDVIFDMRYHKHTEYDEILDIIETLKDSSQLTILHSTYAIQDPSHAAWSPILVEGYVSIDRKLLPNSGSAFYHRKRLSAAQASYLRDGPWQHDVSPSWPRANP